MPEALLMSIVAFPLMKDLCKLLEITKLNTTACYPE